MNLKFRLRQTTSASTAAAEPSVASFHRVQPHAIKPQKASQGVRFDLPSTNQTQHKSLNLPPSLLQDPAFSADPLAHPYNYLTGQNDTIQTWAREPLPGHPALKKGALVKGPLGQGRQRRMRMGDTARSSRQQQQPSTSSASRASGNFSSTGGGNIHGLGGSGNNRDENGMDVLTDAESVLLVPPPPNTPMLVSKWENKCNPAPLQPPQAAAATTTILSRPPTFKTEEPRSGGLVKRLGSVLTRKRSWRGHKASKSHDGHTADPEPPTRLLQRQNSAPRGAERVSRGQGAAGLGPDAPVAATHGRCHTALSDSTALRTAPTNELDRIAELDERNVHHHGPYDAVSSFIASTPRMPLGFENDGRLYEYHERMLKTSGHLYELPKAPDGIPLNLSPGQLLPRNFKRERRKAPRFRNVVAPVQPVIEVTATQIKVHASTVPPRHQNFNQIPFHNHRPSKNARQSRAHRPADENPLDGPPLDPSHITGLVMMRDAGEVKDDELPKEEMTEHLKDVEVDAVVEQQDGLQELEFDPYDPRNFDEAAHPDVVVDLVVIQAHEQELEEQDVPTYPPPPASIQSHFSEEEFHAKRANVTEGNRQFEGLPAGVQYLPPEPSPDTVVTHNRTPSPPPRQAGAPGGSEETLVQGDDELSGDATLVIDPTTSPDTAKKDEMQAQVNEAVASQLNADVMVRRGNLVLGQEPHVIGAAAPITLPMNEAVELGSDDSALEAQHSIDDVGPTLKPNIYVQPRYDKQLPPNPSSPTCSTPPDYTDHMAVVVPLHVAHHATDTAYVPPHLRSLPSPSYSQEKRKSGSGLQRSESLSTQLSQRSSTVSHNSVSSTKVEDGHTTIIGPGKTIVYGSIKPSSSSAAAEQQKKPSSKSKSKQYQPMVILPTLSSSFENEYNRYPQPELKKRPAPIPQQQQSPSSSSSSRSQNKSGSGSGTSRSQLAPIQEVPEHSSKSPMAPDPIALSSSGRSRRSERERERERDREREGSSKRRKEDVYDGSYPRIEVGQVYPKHLLPPRATTQSQAMRPSSTLGGPLGLEPLTHSNPPSSMQMRPLQSLQQLPLYENGAPMSQYMEQLHQQGQPPFGNDGRASQYVQMGPLLPQGQHPFDETGGRMSQYIPRPQESIHTPIVQKDQQAPPPSIPKPRDPYDVSPRSSEESERRPLRVMNVLSQVPEGDESADGHGKPPHPGIQNQPILAPSGQAPDSRCSPPPARYTPPTQEQYRPRMSRDSASSIRPEDSASNRARSVTSYATSTANTHRGPLRPPPLNKHLPKKLVMPAPLQPQQRSMSLQQIANSSQLYGNIFRPRPAPPPGGAAVPSSLGSAGMGTALRVFPNSAESSSTGGNGHPMPVSMLSGGSREPSPPLNVLPPILAQEHLKLPDGNGTQRKLKKRTSLPPPTPQIGSVSPNEALNFEPVILPPQPQPEKSKAKPGPMKLSKRRTNL